MLLLKSFTSDDRSIVPPVRDQVPTSAASCLYFHCASGFSTQILAYMLDSLVRVSRRVNENHFVRIANDSIVTSCPVAHFTHSTTLFSSIVEHTRNRGATRKRRAIRSSIQTKVGLQDYNRSEVHAYLPQAFSHNSN